MRAWTYQDPHQLKRIGPENACYYVGWIDPAGKRRCKSCGPGSRGKKAAERLARKIEGELLAGTYRQVEDKMSWKRFREEYEKKILCGLSSRSQAKVKYALAHFKRLINPIRMSAVTTRVIDEFRSLRRKERGKKKGELVSPATVNKDLRHLKAALRVAVEWEYLTKAPVFHFEKEFGSIPTYFSAEHFAAVYHACDQAKLPMDLPYPASEWWRALLVMGYMTGWRISDMLGLRRDDLDLDAGTAITRARDNKGKRDERVKLHPVVVEHLKKIASFDSHVFPWNHDRTTLQSEFARLQEAAGIKLVCPEDHEHTRFCHVYGFHDLRRAFATMNADRLTSNALQALMRHKSYLTTKVYINMSRQLDDAVDSLHVPDVLRKAH